MSGLKFKNGLSVDECTECWVCLVWGSICLTGLWWYCCGLFGYVQKSLLDAGFFVPILVWIVEFIFF